MSAKAHCALSRFRSQFEHRCCIVRLDSMVCEPTGIDRTGPAERSQRPGVQCQELRWTQPFADGPLGELMPETQEIAVALQHSALDAFLDRGKITLRDLPNKGRLARLAEHGRRPENLLSRR